MLMYGKKFIEYCLYNSIGTKIDDVLHLTETEFESLNSTHPIVEIKGGGIVLGKLHIDGGINILQYQESSGYYKHIGEMEGMEYITGELFIPALKDFYEKINQKYPSYDKAFKNSFDIPVNCRIYDLTSYELPLIVLRGGERFIINRNSTEKCIDELIELESLYI